MMSNIINCPAKVNLALKVVNRRSDGFHDIWTCFFSLPKLSDSLEFQFVNAPCIEVECDSIKLKSNQENLVNKAASLYSQLSGVKPHWRFVLKKSIPIAAGLGGGSSDAAGTLLLLNSEYKKFGEESLINLAAKIGSDVPFFIKKGVAIGQGRGEKLAFLNNMPDALPLVIVNPGFPVSAKWAYNNLNHNDLGQYEYGHDLIEELSKKNYPQLARFMLNDFDKVLFKKFPILRTIAQTGIAKGALRAMISGSGPTLLFLLSDFSEVNQFEQQIQDEFPALTVFAV